MAENLGQVDVVLKTDGTPAAPGGSVNAPGGIMGGEYIETLLENIESAIEQQTNDLAQLLTGVAGGVDTPGGLGDATAELSAPANKNFSWVAVGKKAMAAFAVAAGVAVGGLVATKKILSKWDDELQRTTDRLSMLNSQAALAGVITSMGNFRRDLQLGRVLGPTLLNIAKMKDAVADNIAPLKNMFSALKARTMEMLWEALAKLTERLLEFSESIVKATKFITSDAFPSFIAALGRSGQSMPGTWGKILGVLLELLGESGRQTEAQREANAIARENADQAAAQNSNQMILSHLATLTGNKWQYQTQTIGAAATGAQINPTGFANSQQPKPSPKSPNQSPGFERNRKRGSGRSGIGS